MERPEHKLNQTIRICLVCEGNNTLKGSFTTGTPHFWPCCSVWYLRFNVVFATLRRKCYFSDLTYVFCLPVEIKRLPSMKPTYKSNISVDYGADLTYIPVRGVARGCKHSSLAQIKVGPGARCTELRRFFCSYIHFMRHTFVLALKSVWKLFLSSFWNECLADKSTTFESIALNLQIKDPQ